MARFEKSTNPTMRAFENKGGTLDGSWIISQDKMTLGGTVNKTLFLLLLTIASAFGAAYYMPSQMMLYVGMFGGLGVALVLGFKPKLAPVLAPLYAILEGIFLGLVSVRYASIAGMDGIVFKAVGLTISTFAVMLLIYKFKIIAVTNKFRTGVIAATMGILLMYVVAFCMNLFFNVDPYYLHDGGWLSIGLSVLIIGVAALNFLLDFDMIEKGVQNQAPKYMEWYGGFALLVTLAWLYFEFLRLLAMLSSSD